MRLRPTTLGAVCEQGGGTIATGPFGSQLHAYDYSVEGTPVVMPQNIGDNRLNEENIARVSEDHVTRLARHRLSVGDIVYSRRGDVERRALIRPENDGWLCGTGCLRVTFGSQSTAAVPAFVSYHLGLPETREWVVRHAVGATMPNLNTSILSNVPLLMPDRDTQLAIAEVLGALDDKIAANATLVSIIDRLQELQVRKASCGARGKRLDSITRMIARGITPEYSDASDSVIVLNQKCVRDRRVSLTPARLTNVASTRDAKMLEVDDALVNSTGQGTLGRAARWSQESPATVDSHITIVRFDPESVDPTFASIALSNTERLLESLAEGSTGQTELRRSLLQSFELALPDLNLQRNVGSALRALGGRADAAQSESAQLAQTRDALLHPLISGRLKVKDAERVVEGVV